MSKSLNKSNKSLLTKTVYGDYGLPFSGAIYNREGLKFPNARTNVKSPYVSVKNIIDPCRKIRIRKIVTEASWINYDPKKGIAYGN